MIKMKVCTIVGIRPQYIKMSILMKKLATNEKIKSVIINIGQHYDYEMAQEFFKEMGLPDADYNLEVSSELPSYQHSEVLAKLRLILKREKPDICLVVGDAYPTFVGTLAAKELKIPVAHVEAGLRSFNKGMVEEIIRVYVDHNSQFLFAPTETAVKNLLMEGIFKEKIFLTGDVTVDVLNENLKEAEKSNILNRLGLEKKNYFLLTLHRSESVDNKEVLESILSILPKLKNVVFPIHPKTKKTIEKMGLSNLLDGVIVTEPLIYFDFIALLKNASVFITDSGGAQKEAFLLKTPCVTVRDETEWMETVNLGFNVVAGTKTENILRCVEEMKGNPLNRADNPFGDGDASERIINILEEFF